MGVTPFLNTAGKIHHVRSSLVGETRRASEQPKESELCVLKSTGLSGSLQSSHSLSESQAVTEGFAFNIGTGKQNKENSAMLYP